MNDIKVIEPISKHTKEFDTVDEFNLYYNKNKEEMDKLTTHKLNKLYLIKGYRITRIKNVLSLKKMKEYSGGNFEQQIELERLDDLTTQLNELKKEVQQMKETINNIIHFLNPQTESPYGHRDYVDNFVGSGYACEIEVSPPSDT